MAGWLGRAASAFSRPATSVQQPFHLPCDCGEQLTGWRVETHQKIACTACRQVHLILPGNIYPVVKPAPAAAPKPAPAKPSDKSNPAATKSKTVTSPAAATKSGALKPVEKAAEPTPEPVAAIDLSPTLQQGRTRRRRMTLVALSILALCAVTGWSLWNRSLREQARAAVPLAAQAGTTALHRGDFVTAKRELTTAVQGLDVLRRVDTAASTIRQSRREAVAGDGLSNIGLMDLAADYLTQAGDWEKSRARYLKEHGFRWIVFDASLTPARGEDNAYEFDVPLAIDNTKLQIAIDFAELRQLGLESQTGQSGRVIFAAQIEDWSNATPPRNAVVARLRNATAFLWSDYESYLAAGFRPDSEEAVEETRTTLAAQRKLMVQE